MRYHFINRLYLVAAVVFCVACSSLSSSTQVNDAKVLSDLPPLRVGVTANYPPIIFKQGDQIQGLEADFALALGEILDREIIFSEIAWHNIFDALEQGEIDIIMSGVSITPEREQRFDFIGPYTTIGQMAIIRIGDAATLGQPGAIHSSRYRVGYVSDTTGANYVKQYLSRDSVAYENSERGIQGLLQAEIDFFVHDAPTVWQLANAHQRTDYREKLLGLYHPLTSEPLGWVVRKDNEKLKADIEPIFDQWQSTGVIDRAVAKWLPTKAITR